MPRKASLSFESKIFKHVAMTESLKARTGDTLSLHKPLIALVISVLVNSGRPDQNPGLGART